MGAFVLDGEAAPVTGGLERPQHGQQIDVTGAELAELAPLEALEVHVADEAPHELERRHAVHAGRARS